MDSFSSGNAVASLDAARLSDSDKQELNNFLQQESQKARHQQTIHSLTDTCFRKCITSKISSGSLDRGEEPCMVNCVDRFLDTNKLVLKNLTSGKMA